jgi:uncharacterized membrane protein
MTWGKGGVKRILDSPWASLGAGLIAAAALLAIWLAAAGSDVLGFFSFLIRFLHVLAAAVWIGLIVFVNFIQLAALRGADEGGRELLNRLLVASISQWLRHASSATVLAGVLLGATTGYILPSLVYGSGVYVPVARSALLWPAVLGALAMWMFVHMYIAPSIELVLGTRPGDAAAKERARARIAIFARVNLILVIPVLLAMVAAAHLY